MLSPEELSERFDSVLLRRCVLSSKSNGDNGAPQRIREAISLSFVTPGRAVGGKNFLLRPPTRLKWRGEPPWKNSATRFPKVGWPEQLDPIDGTLAAHDASNVRPLPVAATNRSFSLATNPKAVQLLLT